MENTQINTELLKALENAFEAMLKSYNGEENLNYLDLKNAENAITKANENKE